MPHLVRHTKRLLVRPLEASDYDSWRESYLTMLPPQNQWDRKPRSKIDLTKWHFREVLKSQAHSRKADRFYDCVAISKSTGELIGQVAAMDVLRGAGQSAFLGYAIFNRHWRKGFGKEAVLAMLDIAFNDLKLHRLEAGIEPKNRSSISLARSIGLRKEGKKIRAVFLGGEWRDLLMYSITCEELGIPWKDFAPPSRAR